MIEKQLARDELIGLKVKIINCTDPSWNDKEGIIIDETKNILKISIDNKVKMIAKKTASFEFIYKGQKVIINGDKINYRPENRIKKIR